MPPFNMPPYGWSPPQSAFNPGLTACNYLRDTYQPPYPVNYASGMPPGGPPFPPQPPPPGYYTPSMPPPMFSTGMPPPLGGPIPVQGNRAEDTRIQDLSNLYQYQRHNPEVIVPEKSTPAEPLKTTVPKLPEFVNASSERIQFIAEGWSAYQLMRSINYAFPECYSVSTLLASPDMVDKIRDVVTDGDEVTKRLIGWCKYLVEEYEYSKTLLYSMEKEGEIASTPEDIKRWKTCLAARSQWLKYVGILAMNMTKLSKSEGTE
jgi:hypothetical protein